MSGFTESIVEEAALAWLASLGYAVRHSPDIAARQPSAKRTDPNYRDAVLDRNSAVRQCPWQMRCAFGEHE